jgi:hypothetical protein
MFIHTKFQLSSLNPDELRQIVTFFQENFRIFQKILKRIF